ncbi:Lysophospholipase L1 [Mycolicibacterium fluoranthenivorans]|uniref:Lysophospholipase L1 n=2 Tax=Mycolicibacterium fluoranthenivorans TaxID=258505 RepID=A0A1G4WX28_9MYCO|nr:Lysophospholipase L1 [Mycolicibacterium fluoranthenivorans]
MITALAVGCGRAAPPTPSRPERPVLTASPQPDATYVSIIGDLYTAGSPSEGEGRKSWPSIAEGILRDQGVRITLNIGAKRGSGYAWHSWPRSVVFIDQVRQVVGSNTKLVIIFGSASDQGNPPSQLNLLVEHTLAEAKAKAPNAKLLIIGPAWALDDPPSGLLQARDVVKAQAEAAGALFVDPLAEAWFAGKPELLGKDGDRPNDAGHVFMAEQIAPLMAQLLHAPAGR